MATTLAILTAVLIIGGTIAWLSGATETTEPKHLRRRRRYRWW